jgi:hypothetical protein
VEPTDLLTIILRSLAHRDAVCNLVLATFRVELTSILSRMAEGDGEEDDLDRVDRLAAQIAGAAGAAGAARLGAVRSEALILRERTIAAQAQGKSSEGAVLVAGLKVIDRILDSAKARSASSVVPSMN